MALNFRKFLKGINLVPKTPAANSQMGDLEVDSSTGRIKYHNGTLSDNIVTASSTDTLTNKTINNPSIVILGNPLVFQETGGGADTISMTAPASVPTSYTFTLPPDPGTIDWVLRSNGLGATSWVPPTVNAIPTGSVFPFAGSVAPASYKLCDGSQYDPALEPALFAVIGTTYNTGGETPGWFRTPDLRGRAVAGRDDMGGTPANRLTTAGSGIDGDTLGAAGGSETHSLTSNENATHNHIQDAHTHGVGTYANAASSVGGSVGGSDGTHTHGPGTLSTGTESANHTHSGSTGTSTTGVSINAGNSGVGVGPSLDGNYTNVNATITLGTAIIADPGHSHSLSLGTQSANHTHTVTSGATDTTGSGHGHAFSLTAAAQSISGSSASTTATNQSSGLGTAHQNTQPTIILNYIIKA